MSLALTNRLEILRDRAQMLASARAFFAQNSVLEVDLPALSKRASVDAHIDLIEAICLGERAYLHSSPEYGMKRLLSEGIGDIYQISHVFRNDERGERHNPEFTLVEWYRCGFTFKEMIEETLAFCSLFFDSERPFEHLDYKEAFLLYVGRYPSTQEERDPLFALEIEPHLKRTVLTGFPPEQAVLARVEGGMALRFEIFFEGMELANGYHELANAHELRARFEQENRKRIADGKEAYPVDNLFLEALEQGFPDCCGVAVGFDRLMMHRHRVSEIDAILPFTWERS